MCQIISLGMTCSGLEHQEKKHPIIVHFLEDVVMIITFQHQFQIGPDYDKFLVIEHTTIQDLDTSPQKLNENKD